MGNYDITVLVHANYWCICNRADMSRIVTDECAQKCIYMYKCMGVYTYIHSSYMLYTLIYVCTRDSSTYNTRYPYRMFAFTNYYLVHCIYKLV